MIRVLHVLPHPGGGAETYIDYLSELAGFDHRRLHISGTRSKWLRGLSAGRRWPALAVQAREADLVHAHGDTAAMLVAPLLRRRPSVITTHGLHRMRRSSSGLAGRGIRGAVSAARRTICTSEAERQELVAVMPANLAQRLIVVRNGVPVRAAIDAAERGEARRALGLAGEDVVALFVGQLEERKDPLVALSAVRAVRERGTAIVLLVAGKGPLAREVAACQSDGVRPLGFRSDLRRLHAAADIYILPSRREGTAMALLDAMSYGLAVVVSETAGNTETVGDAGVRFPAGDAAALTAQLVELGGDPARRRALGGAARDRVRAEFGIEAFLSGTRDAYQAALEPG